MTLHRDLFTRLDASIAELWARASASEPWQRIVAGGFSPELYRLTMIQIFHYTRHNSINQAVAAFRAEPEQLELLRFVYGHAKDELGHEKLALHDLKSIGLWRDDDALEPPLPATDALINYLYGVALRDGAVARLGYSYWAESAYEHIGPLLLAARKSLALEDRNMTFFVAHAQIDVAHAEQVRAAIVRSVQTPEQADALQRVAVTTLWLTIQLLVQAFEADAARKAA
jgi:pyrroloquinoline quinone (PQQ) biosynthesis protein C